MKITAREIGPQVAAALGDGWTWHLEGVENEFAMLANTADRRLLILSTFSDPKRGFVKVEAYFPAPFDGKTMILGPAVIKVKGEEIETSTIARRIVEELLPADDAIRNRGRA